VGRALRGACRGEHPGSLSQLLPGGALRVRRGWLSPDGSGLRRHAALREAGSRARQKEAQAGIGLLEPQDDQKAAWDLFKKAYERQMKGEFEEAVKLYTESVELYPIAEAYTFRGWTHSFMGMLDEAIEDCHRAIAVDPDFGNPYNDIGAYLIEKGQLDYAIEWLEKATRA